MLLAEVNLTKRDVYLSALRRAVGAPYRYGGNGPDSFDCSGVVLWAMREAGVDVHDMTAQAMADRWRDAATETIQPGVLFFYGTDSENISHVMTVLDSWDETHFVLVGARGGDGTTLDNDHAWSQRALVGVVLGDYWRSQFQRMVDPWIALDKEAP